MSEYSSLHDIYSMFHVIQDKERHKGKGQLPVETFPIVFTRVLISFYIQIILHSNVCQSLFGLTITA